MAKVRSERNSEGHYQVLQVKCCLDSSLFSSYLYCKSATVCFTVFFHRIQFGTLLGNGYREMNHRILSCLSNYAENTPRNEGNKLRAKFNS